MESLKTDLYVFFVYAMCAEPVSSGDDDIDIVVGVETYCCESLLGRTVLIRSRPPGVGKSRFHITTLRGHRHAAECTSEVPSSGSVFHGRMNLITMVVVVVDACTDD